MLGRVGAPVRDRGERRRRAAAARAPHRRVTPAARPLAAPAPAPGTVHVSAPLAGSASRARQYRARHRRNAGLQHFPREATRSVWLSFKSVFALSDSISYTESYIHNVGPRHTIANIMPTHIRTQTKIIGPTAVTGLSCLK